MKKNPIQLMLLAAGISLIFSSCGGASDTKTTSSEAPQTEEAVVVEANPFALGEKIYNEKCIVCHLATGEGVTGAFPSIKGSEYLKNNRLGAVAQALNGAPGGSVINGVKYSAPMPPQVDTHEEAVAVINYIANHFGNDFGMITVEDAKGIVINPR